MASNEVQEEEKDLHGSNAKKLVSRRTVNGRESPRSIALKERVVCFDCLRTYFSGQLSKSRGIFLYLDPILCCRMVKINTSSTVQENLISYVCPTFSLDV